MLSKNVYQQNKNYNCILQIYSISFNLHMVALLHRNCLVLKIFTNIYNMSLNKL